MERSLTNVGLFVIRDLAIPYMYICNYVCRVRPSNYDWLLIVATQHVCVCVCVFVCECVCVVCAVCVCVCVCVCV